MVDRTIVDQIEVLRDGVVMVRLAKQTLRDDGTIVRHEYHRTGLVPGADFDTLCELVNAHLVSPSMNEQPVTASEWERVRSIVKTVHTKDAVKAFKIAAEQREAKA